MYNNDTGYFYFYDDYLSDKKYQAEIYKIEARLLELGLQGRKERLTLLKNTKEIIEDGIKRGAKSIIVLGNDATISKTMPVVAEHKDVVLGIIPVGPNQNIAKLLGVPMGEAACETLSKRVVKKVDLGKINDHYFLFSVAVPVADSTIKCDNKYSLSVKDGGAEMHICNIGGLASGYSAQAEKSNPADGQLEAVITPRKGWGVFKKNYTRESVFRIKKATINTNTAEPVIVADGQTLIKSPAKIEVVPNKLSLIVGKNRQF